MSDDERIVLVLQGGGALGAYQAGAYAALAESGHRPSWVAGISIGAINAAIIAGNPPERRAERLHEFWNGVSAGLVGRPLVPGLVARSIFNEGSAALAALVGVSGFFTPRLPPAPLQPAGSLEAISYYDTTPLLRTLERLVDFDLLNSGDVRLSVGAVNVGNGNFAYFDTRRMRIEAKHIMASGALPPGFPPVEIDGQFYWDGGLVSNTPLQYVLDSGGDGEDLCVFQVDLFSARGPQPQAIWEIEHREKDIRFSSRTRLNTDIFKNAQKLRRAAMRLSEKLPEELRDDPDAKLLRAAGCEATVTIVHLIHRRAAYTTGSKDYEFSRISVEDHWRSGEADVRRTLRQPAWVNRTRPEDGVQIFDLARDGTD